MENGLWQNSTAPVSSLRSNIGKSTIQQKRKTFSSNWPARLAASTRTAPMILETSSNSPAPKKTAWPGPALERVPSSALTSSSVRNLAIGPVSAESSPTRTHARPLAPCSTANSPSWSKNLRGWAAVSGTASARTCLPANALKPESAKMPETSVSSSLARRSGLSEP